MRMSCNGCRVLRKGCSDDCSIRPCLEWIKSPASQANATVFLAKFYGRAGLINLINAAPHHLRPATFRSMLYEASGRIVNPVYGSVGLMWSGNWQLCNDAVEAVLNGAPITQLQTDETKSGPPLKASCDIRHVNNNNNSTGSNDLSRVRNRCRFKRTGTKSGKERVRSPSHESSLSHQSATAEATVDMESPLSESLGSAETAQVEVEPNSESDDGEIELELTLGFEPIKRCGEPSELKPSEGVEPADEGRICKMELGL